jgi:lysophosphatidylglycerol acyltransferase 1
VESGAEMDGFVEEETLVLANHQSTSDVPLLMAAFAARPELLPRLNWIMDAVFKYTNFGIVSTLHNDFFINAGREKREGSIGELMGWLEGSWVPLRRKWLVLFPEGGFLRKRMDTSNRYALRLGLPPLQHVTLPRMGAMQAILDTLAPKKGSEIFLEVLSKFYFSFRIPFLIKNRDFDFLQV